MRSIAAVTQANEKPGRLALAIMAWQRQLADQQKQVIYEETPAA